MAKANTNSKAIITNKHKVIIVIKPEKFCADNERNTNTGNCTKGDNITKVHKSPG